MTEVLRTVLLSIISIFLLSLSHDGKYLLWSTRQGTRWIDVKALEQLKPGELK